MIKVMVNGKACELARACSVMQMLQTLGFDAEEVAIAVNGEVIHKCDYGSHGVAAEDRLDIVVPMQGG